jgi:hypothetical protein
MIVSSEACLRVVRAKRRLSLLVLAPVLLTMSGCVGAPDRASISEQAALVAVLPGYENARFWGDEAPPDLEVRIAERRALMRQRSDAPQTLSLLAISGGGENGAFGAGLLNGWTESGTRPEFEVVTGISTGALTAPFAFLGSAYDDELKAIYTTTDRSQVFRRRIIRGLLGGSSLTDSTPLVRTIERYATEELLDEIAAEHSRGRRLFIGTTNLDLGRPVIWDVGAIANSGRPDRLALFRKILLASASIPGAFPPVEFSTTSNGAALNELHVDGGVANQVFAYPPDVQLSRFTGSRRASLYIIRNSKERPEFTVVQPGLFAIGGRSTSVLVRTQGIGDLYRLYLASERDSVDYNLIMMPDSFDHVLEHPFDTAYMGALFQVGYDVGKSRVQWRKAPPGLETAPRL